MIINIIIVSRNSSSVNSGGFLVSPAPLTVVVGTEAVFQCQYTITPRSNVPGARNGTSLTLQGTCN